MNEYILGVLGIAVSIGLFLIGYRQTIGAKKERVRSANDEIQKTLMRRIVLEDYTPRVEHLGRVLDGKAREARVRSSDLLSEGQILNNLFTRVVETDFIPSEQREKLLDRLGVIIGETEEEPLLQETLDRIPSQAASIRITTITMATMGGLASLVGALIAALPEIKRKVETGFQVDIVEVVPMTVGTAAVSISLIVFMIVLYRIRERQQEEPSKASAVSEYVDFERDVVNVINQAGAKARVAGPENRGYDFIIEPEGRKILVEVKAWKQPMPSRIVGSVVDQLRQAMSREGAKEAILVTRTSVPLSGALREDDRISVMTLRDFKNYLSRVARG